MGFSTTNGTADNVLLELAVAGDANSNMLEAVAPGPTYTLLNGTGTGSSPSRPMMPRGPDPHVVHMHAILYFLHSYYQPSIIGLGLVFNTAALLVLLPSKLAALSSTRYLVASTMVDLLYLITLTMTWMSERGVALYRMGAFCHVTTFLLGAASFLATWYAVALSVDRFLSLCFPGWQRTLCSPTRANVVVVGLALLALVVYLNISLTAGVVRIGPQYVCTSLHTFVPALTVLSRIHAFLNILLPYSLLLLLWLVGAARCCFGRSSAAEMARRRTTVVVTRTEVSFSENHVHASASRLADGENATYFLYVLTLLILTGPLQFEQCRQTLHEMSAAPSGGGGGGGSGPPSPPPQSAMLLLQLLKYPYYTRFCLNFFICISTHRGFRLVLSGLLSAAWHRLCQVVAAPWRRRRRRGGGGCGRRRHKDVNKISRSGSALSLEDLQEEEQSRVALCAGGANNDSACSRV